MPHKIFGAPALRVDLERQACYLCLRRLQLDDEFRTGHVRIFKGEDFPQEISFGAPKHRNVPRQIELGLPQDTDVTLKITNTFLSTLNQEAGLIQVFRPVEIEYGVNDVQKARRNLAVFCV